MVITIEAPDLEFISYLTSAIIPEGYAEQATAPIGTGPFQFISLQRAGEHRAEAF